jgi:hypothetical protein
MAATVKASIGEGALDRAELERLPAVTQAEIALTGAQPELTLASTDVQATLIGLLDLATRQGVRLTDLRSTQANLEDVFLSLTGRSYAAGNEEPAETNDAKTRRGRRGKRNR